ncbi:MAG: cell division protein FtsZ [Candidatus Micrarchaeaceae archaeon]
MSDVGTEFLGSNSEAVDEIPQIKIVTVGVGGGGSNTVNRLLNMGVKGTELVAVNTDVQHFRIIDDRIKKVLIGKGITRGLGAGGDPMIGRKAAEADRKLISDVLKGSHLVFLCAGMGGGTGTGAAPVIAQVAKEEGAIVMAMVTYPFDLERQRKVNAEAGINELRKYCDSVIILDNNRVVKAFANSPMNTAFEMADSILAKAIIGLVWTITQESLIRIDFADVKAVMSRGEVGFISVGTGKGAGKVEAAVEGVMKNKLLDVDFEDAKGGLLHITGSRDLTLGDAIRAGSLISERMSPSATIKFGARIMPGMEDQLEIVAIITGVKGGSIVGKISEKSESHNASLDFI